MSYYRNTRFKTRNLPTIVTLLIYCLVPVMSVLGFRYFTSKSPSFGDIIFLSIFAVIASVIFCSILRGPHQFFVALKERIIWPFGQIIVLFLRILNLLQTVIILVSKLFLTLLKYFIAGAVIILYIVSPIDLIPDLIPILGWIDDIAVTIISMIVAFRKSLFWSKITIYLGLKQLSQDIKDSIEITTPFP